MSHMNESCHKWMSHVTYEWVMSQMNESCHIWMSHVTYEWFMSRRKEWRDIWMSRVTYERVMHIIHMGCHSISKQAPLTLHLLNNSSNQFICPNTLQHWQHDDVDNTVEARSSYSFRIHLVCAIWVCMKALVWRLLYESSCMKAGYLA